MVGTTNVRPNGERRIDIEGGPVSELRDLKSAAEVAASTLDAATLARVKNELADRARDEDTSLTRATRDRDRATPRDTADQPAPRLQQQLPAATDYREGLSPRQRKLRSATKNRVMAAAPETQTQAVETMVGDEDATRWRAINAELHAVNGNVHKLKDPDDRKLVQRFDRAIQAYERENDRDHRLYFSVEMPKDADPVIDADSLPSTMRIGERVTLDQFTLAKHDPAELPGHGANDQDHVLVELVTNRGLYLGRSDTIADTTHVLPRGIDLEYVDASRAPFHSPTGLQYRVIVQARERKPVVDEAPTADPWGTAPPVGFTHNEEGHDA